MTKKIIAMLICTVMLISVMPTSFAKTTMFNSDTLIELEKCSISRTSTLTKEKDKNASGGYYLLCTRSGNNDDPDSAAPELTFDLNIVEDGEYNIWFRYSAESKSNDTVYINFDDELMNGTAVQVSVLTKEGEYYWKNMKVQNLTKGEHKVKITPREPNMRLDALYITADAKYRPEELILLEQKAAEEKAVAEAAAIEAAKTGIYFNNKAPNFKIGKGDSRIIIEAENMLLNDKISVYEDKDISGGKGIEFVGSAAKEVPISTPGDAEFSFTAGSDGDYTVWVKFAAATNANDSIFASYNGSLYTSDHIMSTSTTGSENTYKWIKVHIFENAKASDTYNLRFVTRERQFRMDQIVVTSNPYFMPSGNVKEIWSGNTIKAIDIGKSPYNKPPQLAISHPRVMVTSEDIPRIKENMTAYENKNAYEKFLHYLSMDINEGKLPESTSSYNYSATVIEAIYALAFDYLINGNEQHGKDAIIAVNNFLDTVTWPAGSTTAYGWKGHLMYVSACIYDWCYDLMDNAQREELLAKNEYISAENEIGFPPNAQGVVTGHSSEFMFMRDWVAMAIAAADEYPDVYDFVIGRLYDEYVAPRLYYYKSGTHHQGTHYGQGGRYVSDLWCVYLMEKAGQSNIFGTDMRDFYYNTIYQRRPDGQLLRLGDVFEEGLGLWGAREKIGSFLSANIYKDPYYKRAYALVDPDYSGLEEGYAGISAVSWLIFNDSSIGQSDSSNLPLSRYFPAPDGSIIARTGWDLGNSAPDVMAYMNIGEVWGANHDHRDAGQFQIYYKGILASDSGSYYSYGYTENGINYDESYHKATIAHNTLLIYNPDEAASGAIANTGGQIRFGGEVRNFDVWMKNDQYRTGYVLSHEIDDAKYLPRYNYISGDLTPAYADRADEVLRSMLFMPTDDKSKPAVFFVMDKITSKNAKYEKYWLLHSLYEPEINGNMQIIKNTKNGYNGQLVNTTVYPKNINIETYGDETENKFKDFQIKDKSRWGEGAEINCWRIDVTPESANTTDYFLNAMYVCDADGSAEYEKAETVESEDMYGAVLVDRAAMFVKDNKKVSSQSFALPSRDNLKVFVAGLEAGEYEIKENGNVIASSVATDDGGCIFFEANGGSYTITNIDKNAKKSLTEHETKNNQVNVLVKYSGSIIYCDVPARIVDDRTLIPFRALFEAMSCDVEYDGATSSATATDGMTTIVLTENDKTAYVNGEAYELDVPAQIIDDRFLIPLRFVSESMGSKVDWSEFGQIVDIGPTSNYFSQKYGIKNIITVKDMTGYDSEKQSDEDMKYAIDRDITTRWAPYGKEDGEAWGIFDLGDVYTIDKMYIGFYNASGRIYKFDIQISEDGENFKNFMTGVTVENSKNVIDEFDFGATKARYIKYIGRGNSVNLYNSVNEIVFTEKK